MTIDAGIVAVGLSVVTTAAAALASYVTLRERVVRHDRSIENFGARLEAESKERTGEIAELRATIAELDKRLELTADRADQSRPYRLPPPGGGGGTRG
jgi:Skp family chaperone for outer membrane proteins